LSLEALGLEYIDLLLLHCIPRDFGGRLTL